MHTNYEGLIRIGAVLPRRLSLSMRQALKRHSFTFSLIENKFLLATHDVATQEHARDFESHGVRGNISVIFILSSY